MNRLKSEQHKTIGILTATRAEYGLLKPVIEKLIVLDTIDVKVIVTGSHLSPEFGMTVNEIKADKIPVSASIPILLSSDTPNAISKSMGIALISFADYFQNNNLDALIVLGDRYETLAVCIASFNARIPIIHLYGGETTEGAIDEAYRHSITKMSSLHFTSTNEYRNRVIQLGESPDRVYNVGAIGIENAQNISCMSRNELSKSLNFDLQSTFAVVTFHPVTLEDDSSLEQVNELLHAIDNFSHIRFIFTKANSDTHGRIINQKIEDYVKAHKNTIFLDSLGMQRYLSALRYASFAMGNSSSGLIEVPSFGIPSINIGDRQKGRLKALSVFDCLPISTSIIEAINIVTANEFKEKAKSAINPYGDGYTSNKIVKVIIENLFDNTLNLKKKFYNIEIK